MSFPPSPPWEPRAQRRRQFRGCGGAGRRGQEEVRTPPAAAQTPARLPPGSGNGRYFSLCPPTRSTPHPPGAGGGGTPTSRLPNAGAPARSPREGNAPSHTPAHVPAPVRPQTASPSPHPASGVASRDTALPSRAVLLGARALLGDGGRLHPQLSSRPPGAKPVFSGLSNSLCRRIPCFPQDAQPIPIAAGIPSSQVARALRTQCASSGPPGGPAPRRPPPPPRHARLREGVRRLLTSGSAPWGCICLCFSS